MENQKHACNGEIDPIEDIDTSLTDRVDIRATIGDDKPFDCKNLKIGKTYKGLKNNRTFTVRAIKKKTILNNIYKKVFIAVTDDNQVIEISPHLRLYIQEV